MNLHGLKTSLYHPQKSLSLCDKGKSEKVDHDEQSVLEPLPSRSVCVRSNAIAQSITFVIVILAHHGCTSPFVIHVNFNIFFSFLNETKIEATKHI